MPRRRGARRGKSSKFLAVFVLQIGRKKAQRRLFTMHIKLVVADGQGEIRTVLLRGKEITIGREEGNGVLLDDPFVSRRHAQITYDRQFGWALADLDSRNGLKLNSRKMEHPESLRPGDEILIGPVSITVLELSNASADNSAQVEAEKEKPLLSPLAQERTMARPGKNQDMSETMGVGDSAPPVLAPPFDSDADANPEEEPHGVAESKSELLSTNGAERWRDSYARAMDRLRVNFDKLWEAIKPRTPARLAGEMAALHDSVEGAMARLHRVAEGIEETNDQLCKLLEAARTISAPQPLRERLETILDLAIEKMGADCGFLMLYSRRRQGLTLALQRGIADMQEEVDLESSPAPNGKPRASLAREAVRKGSTVVGGAILHDSKHREISDTLATKGVHAAICAPMKVENRFLGLIYVEFRNPCRLAGEPLGQADVDWLESLGSLAELAIENARLIQKNKAKDQE